MKNAFYMASRYMRRHKGKTAILIASIAMIVFLPLGLQTVVDQTTSELEARARSTPLLVGRKGSPLELALSSLYFAAKPVEPLAMADVDRIRDTGFALPIPLHVRYRAREQPIVGTSLEYFDFRALRVADGRQMATLGECVVGASAAEALEVGPGDAVTSSPTDVFNLAGAYPLKMRVVGVLARSHSPDDDAVFVDMKTAWVIEGIGHGHDDVSKPEMAGQLLKRDGNKITASAQVREYQEITAKQAESFHFHGDPATFPVTAVLAVPNDAKSQALLRGRYLGKDERDQIIEPVAVMDELVTTVVKVRSYVTAAVVLLGISTLLMMTLVFALSIRLRRREMETMTKIGCSRGTIASLLGCEIGVVLAAGVAIAIGLTTAAHAWGPALLREVLL